LVAARIRAFVEHVTDRTSNPFGMRAPCEGWEGERSEPSDDRAGRGTSGSAESSVVYGYGDPNGDFHLIGDHPGAHGGRETGIPFTGSTAGERLQPVLAELGFSADADADEPAYDDLFTSYRYMCPTPDDRPPTDDEYARLERYFDAELRAINAHVLLPVGERATDHVLRSYTTRAHKVDLDMRSLHAGEVRGRGFMVVPVRDPDEWADGDRDRLLAKLAAVLESDYRQTKGVATLVG
jgi:uracil-DNA glycosylase family 4